MSARRAVPNVLHNGELLAVGTHRFVWSVAAQAANGLQWAQFSAADAVGLMGGRVTVATGTISSIRVFATFDGGALSTDVATSLNPVWQEIPATISTPVPTPLGNVTEGKVILESGDRGRNSLMVEVVVSQASTGFYLLAHGVGS
jgi:hypothetical protein